MVPNPSTTGVSEGRLGEGAGGLAPVDVTGGSVVIVGWPAWPVLITTECAVMW